MSAAAGGYVGDVPYVRAFIRELAPAWLDFVAALWGVAPPARGDGFAWCDLGCGQGVTAVALAALHPEGRFHGIDMLAPHVDHARRLAAAANVGNATFDAADFATAAARDQPQFDYIVAHGVYSWVDEAVRADLRRFIDRHLKPGGLAYVSYNALPGRAADLPFQRLLRHYGAGLAGDSGERVAAALALAHRLYAMKVPALVASPMAERFAARRSRPALAYLAHEFMNASWEPLGVIEVRKAMAEIGLEPAGSATLVENIDNFMLGKAARRLLARIDDRDIREFVRDCLIDQFFRRDVFVRAGAQLSDKERRASILATTVALAHPSRRVEYRLATPAGRVTFDNAAARHILRMLAAGPRRLAELASPAIGQSDIIANALVLAAARLIHPVEGGNADVAAFNSAVLARLGGTEELRILALPCGTAVPASPKLLAALRDGGPVSAAWRQYLRRHEVAVGAGPITVPRSTSSASG